MNENVNTQSYWNRRFSSGDWEAQKGRFQTENFARGQTRFIKLSSDFEGALLDFGCGLGDAIPIYRQNYPKATLMGIDISNAAIDICQEKYGSIAEFISGDFTCVPEVDAIIASNVFEHLENDQSIARHLLSKCRDLYIIVPHKEFPLSPEHVNSYDEESFKQIGKYDYKVFPCVGWSQYGFRDLWFQIHFKNLFRPFLGRPLSSRSNQILFHFKNTNTASRDKLERSW
jgi:hypothetical protein